MSYYCEYGELPVDTNSRSLLTNNTDLIYTLIASNAGANAANAQNPKSIVFFELHNHKNAFIPSEGGFLDPWGNPYHVTFDLNNSNRIVTVWSSGPNGKDESGQGDDITSWR